jgi:hypothetical protein
MTYQYLEFDQRVEILKNINKVHLIWPMNDNMMKLKLSQILR